MILLFFRVLHKIYQESDDTSNMNYLSTTPQNHRILCFRDSFYIIQKQFIRNSGWNYAVATLPAGMAGGICPNHADSPTAQSTRLWANKWHTKPICIILSLLQYGIHAPPSCPLMILLYAFVHDCMRRFFPCRCSLFTISIQENSWRVLQIKMWILSSAAFPICSLVIILPSDTI